jgi:glycosyltransferase involved in cell wall biosynthesis
MHVGQRRSDRMRVLHVIPDLGRGGAERMLLNLSVNLDRSAYEVVVVSMYGAMGSPVERELGQAGIPVVHLGKRLGFDGSMFPRVLAALARHRPEIVHTHRGVLHYALPALCAFRSMRVVHTVHNLAPLEVPTPFRLAHRAAFHLGVVPVAVGTAVAASFEQVYGRPVRATIANGIPVSQYASPVIPRDEWRARERVPSERFVFICAGRLEPQKNMSGLVAAFARIRARGDPATLIIAGEGPLRRDLEALARGLGVERDVLLLGTRADMPDALGAANAFALASDWEGNPLAVMEAMAAGLPVVGTSVGGIPEIVDHGVSGLLVDPGRENELADAMHAMVVDVAGTAAMSSAAKRRAREFDVSVMVRRYADLYQALARDRLGRGSGRATGDEAGTASRVRR